MTTIRHGVTNQGGMGSFDLYVTLATTAGFPPPNYTTNNLWSALGLTAFSSGAQTVNGNVAVPPGLLNIAAGTQYALIFVKPGGGSIAHRVTSGGGAYTRGDGYVLTGATWATSGGCSGTFHDAAFVILGNACAQANSPAATLLVNGIGAAPTPGPFSVNAPAPNFLTLTWAGPPGSPIELLTGPLNQCAGSFGCTGSLDIGTFPFFNVLPLYAPLTVILDSTGALVQNFSIPAGLAGSSIAVQGVVFQPTGLPCSAVLTAAFSIAF